MIKTLLRKISIETYIMIYSEEFKYSGTQQSVYNDNLEVEWRGGGGEFKKEEILYSMADSW